MASQKIAAFVAAENFLKEASKAKASELMANKPLKRIIKTQPNPPKLNEGLPSSVKPEQPPLPKPEKVKLETTDIGVKLTTPTFPDPFYAAT